MSTPVIETEMLDCGSDSSGYLLKDGMIFARYTPFPPMNVWGTYDVYDQNNQVMGQQNIVDTGIANSWYPQQQYTLGQFSVNSKSVFDVIFRLKFIMNNWAFGGCVLDGYDPVVSFIIRSMLIFDQREKFTEIALFSRHVGSFYMFDCLCNDSDALKPEEVYMISNSKIVGYLIMDSEDIRIICHCPYTKLLFLVCCDQSVFTKKVNLIQLLRAEVTKFTDYKFENPNQTWQE